MQSYQEELLKQAQVQLHRHKVAMARATVAQANQEMQRLCHSAIQKGLVRTAEEAARFVVHRYGENIAKTVEDNLRNMGAQVVRVTCP